jgi:hypothetical protein
MDSYRDPKELKHKVIWADAVAPTLGMQRYVSVSNTLHLDEASREELKGLYENMLTPIYKFFDSIRPMVLYSFNNVNNGAETKKITAREFWTRYSNAYDSEDLKDKEHVKAKVVYPLLVAVLNSWRKYDPGFSTQLIGFIKYKEDEAKLKRFIDSLDSVPAGRGLIRH